ncbi:MAG: Lacal_2735 family protein [Gammaproteobacteria bacterium]|nr:Lacal_2735 family protein [Gammaproteobacteria bacterium]
MFSMFKRDPIKKLTQQQAKLLEQAMFAQRNGDIKSYSLLTAEAEELNKKIDALKSGAV